MKTNDELIEEFAKLHSTNPPTQIITSSRKKVEDWLRTVLTQKDAEVARERERIVEIVKGKELLEVAFDSDSLMWKQRINALLKDIISLITNKGNTNN
jgi:hypothetical protein